MKKAAASIVMGSFFVPLTEEYCETLIYFLLPSNYVHVKVCTYQVFSRSKLLKIIFQSQLQLKRLIANFRGLRVINFC